MIQRAFRFLSSEVLGLQRAVYILALCALLSSLLALFRDRFLAHAFGAGVTVDVYYAAFRIPDLIFVGVAALVSVYMLIPELARRTEAEKRDYIDTIIVGFLILATAVSCAAAIFAPSLLQALFPVLSAGGHLGELTLLTRIMLLQPILLGLSNILAALTQSRNRYTLYAISPLLYNGGIILGIVVFYPVWGIMGLAWGVVLGALLHCIIQIPSIVSDGYFKRVPRIIEPKALFETASLSIPRALALSMNQVAFLGLTALAGALSSGSIAIFMFAYNLASVPLSMIGASYSVAAFPTLASALSLGQRGEFIEHVGTAARFVFFWSLPIIALIVVLRAHIVRVVLGSGAFNWTDTRLTAAAFALFSLALAAQGISLLLVRGYYAAGRTFTPFLISAGTALGAVGLGSVLLGLFHNGALIPPIEALLRIEDVPGSPVLVLAFSYALTSIVGAIVLTIAFERRFGGFFVHVARSLWQGIVASLAGGSGAYVTLLLLGPLTLSSTLASVFVRGFAGGVAGCIVAALAYSMLRNREFFEIYAVMRKRFSRFREPQPAVTVAVSAEDAGSSGPQ